MHLKRRCKLHIWWFLGGVGVEMHLRTIFSWLGSVKGVLCMFWDPNSSVTDVTSLFLLCSFLQGTRVTYLTETFLLYKSLNYQQHKNWKYWGQLSRGQTNTRHFMFIIELISKSKYKHTGTNAHTDNNDSAHERCLFFSLPNAPSTRFDIPGSLLLEIVFPSLFPLSLPSSTETRSVRWNWLSLYNTSLYRFMQILREKSCLSHLKLV